MKKRIVLVLSFILTIQLCYALEGPFSVEKLALDSDRIVRGRVMNLSYTTGTNGFGDQLIYTNVSIHTSEALKGERSDLILMVEGGKFNGITLTVSDAPEFGLGQEVLVFAKKDSLAYRPVSGLRSKYTIAKNGTLAENNVYYGSFKKTVLEALRKSRSSQ